MWERLKATGRAIKHRRLTFALVVAFLTIGVVGGLYAIQTGATFSGQTQAGDHEWWQDIAGNGFCENCHTDVAGDILAGPHGIAADGDSDCSFCHTPGGTDHAAASSACTDCHSTEGGEVASPTEAHSGILTSLGETAGDASQTCQSCHTHAEVDMTVYADAPIPLQMGTPP